jgi:DNA-binding MarR family transcriptional regulator
MASSLVPDLLVDILRATMVALVAGDRRDLNARQLAIFLTCYLSEGPHTVRGLAKHLNVSKPAITRALDTLTEAELVVRKPEPGDRRSVVVKRTAKGAAFLRDLRTIMGKPAEANHPTNRPPMKGGRT